MIIDTEVQNALVSPVRSIKAKVELYNGSTLANTFPYNGELQEYSIERNGEEGKFFGFGICQKINVKLRDVERKINISTANSIKAYLGINETYSSYFPSFNVTEVHRDEITNALSITAYDALYKATNYTVADLPISAYTINEFVTACADLLGLTVRFVNIDTAAFATMYENGANFEGTETIREALDAAAEATQTIYYVDNGGLVFKRLSDAEAVLTVGKNAYFDLEVRTNRRLATITHATELGDNVSASITQTGTTQFVRNNPFWELREDIADLVNNALAAVGGLTINQFEINWRGNYLVEIGDKLGLTTKDNEIIYSYLLNDTITYNGGLVQKTEWNYNDNKAETAANPTTLGEAIKQTYARVDKANKEIELLASEVSSNGEKIANIELNTESISASVSNLEQVTTSAFGSVDEELATLNNKVEAAITAEDVNLQITNALSNGVDKVVTTTGFTFNEEGLTVSKTGAEMKTTITEDGMTVYRDNTAVLTANHDGVDAVNLHATTYLIIGTNSRFEDYGSNRTGCFWIGG